MSILEDQVQQDYLEASGPPGQQDRPPLRRRRRLSPTNLDLRNTWGIIVGALLLPLGIAVILLGWNGAAHGRVDQQQLPYVISGGVLGLAIVIIGCFFYWSHWLYRIYDQADLHHREMLREQRDIMRELAESIQSSGSRAPVAADVVVPAGARPARKAQTEVPVSTNGSTPRSFVATPTGTNFHAPGCPMISNRGSDLRVISEAESTKMRPCRVCEPLVHAN